MTKTPHEGWIKTEVYYRSPYKIEQQREEIPNRWFVYRGKKLCGCFPTVGAAMTWCNDNP